MSFKTFANYKLAALENFENLTAIWHNNRTLQWNHLPNLLNLIHMVTLEKTGYNFFGW